MLDQIAWLHRCKKKSQLAANAEAEAQYFVFVFALTDIERANLHNVAEN